MTRNLTPPQAARDAAARALQWRKQGRKGALSAQQAHGLGIGSGAVRAATLAHGRDVSPDTVKRMASYFARHEVDKRAQGFRESESGFPSRGRVAWDAWGGDAGRDWAMREAAALRRNPIDLIMALKHTHGAIRAVQAAHKGLSTMRNPIRNPRMPMSKRELRKPLLDYRHWQEAWFREVVQNSLDAEATRIDFTTRKSGANLILTARDNGVGMREWTLLNKFLVLGATSKGAESIGGFGEAKKLLLWPWRFWMIASRHYDDRYPTIAGGIGDEFDILTHSPEWRDGDGMVPREMIEGDYDEYQLGKKTRKTVKWPTAIDPDTVFLEHHDRGTVLTIVCDPEECPKDTDLIAWASKCSLPDSICKITFNGKRIVSDFSESGYKKLTRFCDPYVDVFFCEGGATGGDSAGTLVVQAQRIDGSRLAMWSEELSGINGNMQAIILGNTKEALTSNRDAFRDNTTEGYWPQLRIREAKQKLQVDPLSATSDPDNFVKEYVGDGQVVEVSAVEAAMARGEDPCEAIADAFDIAPKKTKEQTISISIGMPVTTQADTIRETIKTTPEAVKLFAWSPPLRVSNSFDDWRPTDEWLPESMGTYQVSLLRVWTAALRAVLIRVAEFNHRFAVGFIFDKGTLARTGPFGAIPGVRFYEINPFASIYEFKYQSRVVERSLDPRKLDEVIQLDPTNRQHIGVIVSRAIHELTHGVFGVSGHNENFAAIMTSVLAIVGKDYNDMLDEAGNAIGVTNHPAPARLKAIASPAAIRSPAPEPTQRAMAKPITKQAQLFGASAPVTKRRHQQELLLQNPRFQRRR